MTSEQFEILEGIGVPSTKSLDDKGLEGDALGPAIVETFFFCKRRREKQQEINISKESAVVNKFSFSLA